MNSTSINQQRNQDFSLTGALKNYLLYLFSLANCFVENIDNCLDNGATIVQVHIEEINDCTDYFKWWRETRVGGNLHNMDLRDHLIACDLPALTLNPKP